MLKSHHLRLISCPNSGGTLIEKHGRIVSIATSLFERKVKEISWQFCTNTFARLGRILDGLLNDLSQNTRILVIVNVVMI